MYFYVLTFISNNCEVPPSNIRTAVLGLKNCGSKMAELHLLIMLYEEEKNRGNVKAGLPGAQA
jgi:hypothetical protein